VTPAGMKLLFRDDFEDGRADGWEATPADSWRVEKVDGNSAYLLAEPGRGGPSLATRALIKDLQYDALGSDLLHADFQRLVAGEKVEVAIPVELVGEPVGVRRDGGVLDHLRKEITVSCLPGQIPSAIRVDVHELGIRDDITIGDIEWPEGVEPVAPADALVVSVLPPEEVPEEAELEEAKEPELVSRGPEEPEEEAEAAVEPGGPEE